MQAGKSAVASAKETASNIAASAQSGMDKTKAIVQEKAERLSAHDPMEKERATARKEEKINQAELNKQEIREQNAANRLHSGGVAGGTTAGFYDGSHTHGTGPTGMNQMSALPGHGTGQVVEGTAQAHPMGVNTGSGGTVGTNPRAGGETNQGYGTGGSLI
ncbi:hypothetical protein ACHQM5_028734 [Ranunculus cassubicifolius]